MTISVEISYLLDRICNMIRTCLRDGEEHNINEGLDLVRDVIDREIPPGRANPEEAAAICELRQGIEKALCAKTVREVYSALLTLDSCVKRIQPGIREKLERRDHDEPGWNTPSCISRTGPEQALAAILGQRKKGTVN